MTHENIKKAFHIGAILFVINAIITVQGWEALFAFMYIAHKCIANGVDYVGFISPGVSGECPHDVSPEDCPECLGRKDHD